MADWPKNKDTPLYKYRSHVKGARRRSIPFLLTFEEWWRIWQDSGHWAERGKLRGQYVMTRPGDQGAYEVGNVVICTNTENNIEKNQHTRRLYGTDNPMFGKKNYWAGRKRNEQSRKRMSEAAKKRCARLGYTCITKSQ